MTSSNILLIGMDVHKESIEIVIADGASTEVRRYGRIGGTKKTGVGTQYSLILGTTVF